MENQVAFNQIKRIKTIQKASVWRFQKFEVD